MQRQVEDTRHSGVGVKARELRVWAPKSNSIISQFCPSPWNQEVYHNNRVKDQEIYSFILTVSCKT